MPPGSRSESDPQAPVRPAPPPGARTVDSWDLFPGEKKKVASPTSDAPLPFGSNGSAPAPAARGAPLVAPPTPPTVAPPRRSAPSASASAAPVLASERAGERSTETLDLPVPPRAAEVAAPVRPAVAARVASPVRPAPAAEPTEAPAAEPDGEKKKRGPLSFVKELPVLLLVAFLLALLIKSFLVQAFYIPSESMVPTLQIGDRVLVNKVVYHLHPPRRGDVIVFEDPHPVATVHRSLPSAFWHWLTEGFGVSTNPEKDFIKRVIGLPGETVLMKHGVVYVDGRALHEPYLSPLKDVRDYPATLVPAHSLFVMGDNRTNSNDSRFGLGFVPYDKVVGRAFVVIWPPKRISLLHGPPYLQIQRLAALGRDPSA